MQSDLVIDIIRVGSVPEFEFEELVSWLDLVAGLMLVYRGVVVSDFEDGDEGLAARYLVDYWVWVYNNFVELYVVSIDTTTIFMVIDDIPENMMLWTIYPLLDIANIDTLLTPYPIQYNL